MEEKEVLEKVADAVLETPVILKIDIAHPVWWERLLIKYNKMKPYKEFAMKPASLGTLVKISKALLSIEINTLGQLNLLETSYHLMAKHGGTLSKIMAYAVVNREEDPPEKLSRFFLNNLTSKELLQCLSVVLKEMDCTSFLSSIISIRGSNILQTGMSLQTEELIASTELSEAV